MKINMRMFRRKNGIYYYEIVRGQWRSLKTRDKREATQLYNIIKKEALKGKLVELDKGKKLTLRDFKRKFFQEHTDIRPKTCDAYNLAFQLLADSIGWTTLLSRINESSINIFKRNCFARNVRKTSVNTYLRHIRGILNKAFEWGDLKQKVKVEMLKLGQRHPRILTKEEIKKILKYAKAHDYEMYRIILFALWTGARRAEIANLSWQNVNGDMCRLIGKGDKERTIPLLPIALDAMGKTQDIGFVFIHWNDLSKYTKAFKRIARACGIEDIHFHHLRHTAATQMIENGIDERYVQAMLGHAALSTTDIYVKIVQKTLAEKMKKFRY